MTPTDPLATLLHGDTLEVMAGMEAESVDCVVTSPPYLGLRRYDSDQERVWGDDDPNCEHKWGEKSYVRRSNDGGDEGRKQTTNVGANNRDEPVLHATCARCGAWRGAYGLEPTVEMYVTHTIEVLRAVRRVLKYTGVVWWNLGDSYAGSGGSHNENHANPGMSNSWERQGVPHYGNLNMPERYLPSPALKPLDMCLIPERVALAAQADGWWVRSHPTWIKKNPMPESLSGWTWQRCRIKTKDGIQHSGGTRGAANGIFEASLHTEGRYAEWADCPGCPKCAPHNGLVLRKGSWRPTSSTEVILMLTKTADYYGDGEDVRESLSPMTLADKRNATGRHTYRDSKWDGEDKPSWYRAKTFVNPAGRNLRDVWTMPSQPFGLEMCAACKRVYEPRQFQRLRETDGKRKVCGCGASDFLSHFATFPEELVEKCILSSTSARGYCPKCGEPWARIVEATGHVNQRESAHVPNNTPTKTDSTGWAPTTSVTDSWLPTCSCQAGDGQPYPPQPGVVLDPFCGSGTTNLVAKRLGRRSIGVDLSADYLALAAHQLAQIPAGFQLY